MTTKSTAVPFLKPLSTIQSATIPLDSEESIIGRDPSCKVVLDSGVAAGVSRQHVSVRRLPSQNQFVVNDLDSSNGTYVNGQRVQKERPLHSGDRIQLGLNGPQFEFVNPAEPKMTPATVIDSQPSLSTAPNTIIGPGLAREVKPPAQPIDPISLPGQFPAQSSQKPNNWGKFVKWGIGGLGLLIALKFLFGMDNLSRRTASTQPQTPSAPASPASAQPTAPEEPQPNASQPASDPNETLKVVKVSACNLTQGDCTTDTGSFASTDSIRVTTIFANKLQPGTTYNVRLQYSPPQGNPVDLEVIGKKAFPQPVSDFTVALGQLEGGWRPGSYKFVLTVSDNSGSATIRKSFLCAIAAKLSTACGSQL